MKYHWQLMEATLWGRMDYLEEVVVDGNLVSSHLPDDIPAFNREMIKLFSGMRQEARHTG